MQENLLDILWILLSAVLVALMQPGFTALEAGATRTKNSISTALKNLSDFIITFLVFVTFGASIMLGQSYGGWIGWAPIFSYESNLHQIAIVIFQAMFASTAVTIISGAIAERTKYSAYLWIAVIVSLFIYPLQAHWAWNTEGWLAQLGFIDFAGSTVVHSVGGWAALAAILIVGPRIGRFEEGNQGFEQSNLAFSTLGVFLIWLGWIGFNGGSVLALNQQTGTVILNTLIAGAIGGVSGLLFSKIVTRHYQVNDIMHGVLAGLVAITASAQLATPLSSMLIGILGYFSYFFGKVVLLKYKIDDAIEAVPVHLFAGVSGTLAVAFLVPDIEFLTQLKIQLTGIIAIAFLSFFSSYVFLSLLNKFFKLRVSESQEVMGLNISEHQASTSMFDLAIAMNKQAKTQDFRQRIVVDPFSDAALIANYYNHVTQAFNQLSAEKEALLQETYQMAHYDHLTGLAKRRVLVDQLSKSLEKLKRIPETHALLFIDLDGFKKVNDTHGHDAGDIVLKTTADRILSSVRKIDLAARFGGDEFVVLLESIQSESFAAAVADKLIACIREPIPIYDDLTAKVNTSIGMVVFNETSQKNVDDILKAADQAMYTAKRRGKGQWVLG